MGNIENFFNSSKALFSVLQENEVVIVADALSELYYEVIDTLTYGAISSITAELLTIPTRGASTTLPTVVTVATESGVTTSGSTTLSAVTSTSEFTLTSVENLSSGSSITINTETVVIDTIVDLVITTTTALSTLPAVDDVVSFSYQYIRDNTYKVSFTIASADYVAEGVYIKFKFLDKFEQAQSVTIPLPKYS